MNNADSIRKVNDFLTAAETFYLTTIDGNKPKCRPLSFHLAQGDTLYFGVGEFKEVYKQIQQNANVEFCAAIGKEFLRYYGTAVFEPDYAIAEKILAKMPAMQKIYNEQTGYRLGIFHLENSTAEFRTMLGVKEAIRFDK